MSGGEAPKAPSGRKANATMTARTDAELFNRVAAALFDAAPDAQAAGNAALEIGLRLLADELGGDVLADRLETLARSLRLGDAA